MEIMTFDEMIAELESTALRYQDEGGKNWAEVAMANGIEISVFFPHLDVWTGEKTHCPLVGMLKSVLGHTENLLVEIHHYDDGGKNTSITTYILESYNRVLKERHYF